MFAPAGGLSRTSNGGTVINLGIVMRYEKNAELRILSLEGYTEQFLKQCCQSYPGYRVEHQEVSRDQAFPAMDTVVSSIAVDGNREINRLMTIRLPDGFFTMALAVPASQAKPYFHLFGRIIGTLEPGKNSQRQSVADPPSTGLSASLTGVGGNCESFQSDSVSFCYPRGWSVRRTQATPHEVFVVTPNDGSRQSVRIRHLQRPGEVLYLETHKDDLRSFNKNNQYRFTEIGETYNPGRSVTTRLRSTSGAPLTSVVTTIYDPPHLALVAYDYDHTQIRSEAVIEGLLSSFVAGSPTLVGVWRASGTEYTFRKNGDVTMRALFTNMESAGTYQTDGNRISFSWNSVLATPMSSKQGGTYSLSNGKLVLKLDGCEAVAYRKAASE